MDDLTFEVDDETCERVKRLADQHGVTVEEEARRLITESPAPDRDSSSGSDGK